MSSSKTSDSWARAGTRAAGKAHAEIEAIRDAQARGASLRGATVYVTLEPCCTQGRTPPCTEALIEQKVSCVVVAATDPNPAHAGRAYRLLRKAGIKVITGVLADEAKQLNLPFHHWMLTGKPWVVAKAALSIDGKLTRPKGQGKWISSENHARMSNTSAQPPMPSWSEHKPPAWTTPT
ncbi:MAG: bifunctional diaminohydroxyphosphoribosylaminopyrimidine deaminase/5-amino-6-(5-phosphoribosylamino)uracil reductase RibD [Oscillatoriales cyanobacterium RM1_1_9]|nr:bifunctional diaminohydroxyphosphoribosylaminopyrimidine deaminase/5-amino-6-(5-phosphoribosylamino)uracil reductase RibD [Oscillatoriales cyanobacterium RM1_1_9]